jgi:hypothetical protein
VSRLATSPPLFLQECLAFGPFQHGPHQNIYFVERNQLKTGIDGVVVRSVEISRKIRLTTCQWHGWLEKGCCCHHGREVGGGTKSTPRFPLRDPHNLLQKGASTNIDPESQTKIIKKLKHIHAQYVVTMGSEVINPRAPVGTN